MKILLCILYNFNFEFCMKYKICIMDITYEVI